MTHKYRLDEGFKAAIAEAVDEGLEELGESTKNTLYLYAERVCSLKKDEIPVRLEAFSSMLRRIFAQGTPTIEKLIIRRLCEKLNANYENMKESGFLAVVEKLSEKILVPSGVLPANVEG